MMDLRQVLGQQRSGPHRRAIVQLPRVAVDDFRDQRLDDTMSGAGTATACALREACQKAESRVSSEASDPVVDGPATDPHACGHLWDTFSRVKPQQSLGAAKMRGMLRPGDEVLQSFVLPVTERDDRHRVTSDLSW
jgi:hypothetical protein